MATDLMPDLAQQLQRGRPLPSEWYTDPALYELEQRRVFGRSWQYAGHLGKVREPGDYFTCQAGRVPIVVVRGKDGELRAFLNICPHRAHPVASGEGNRSSLQCRYHAWTFKLDGVLSGAPRSEREPDFDKSAHCLTQAQVGCLGELVFVNPDPTAPSLEQTLDAFPGLVGGAGVDVAAGTYRGTRFFDVEANWKIIVENSIECYHCATIHPAMAAAADVTADGYRIECGPGWSVQYSPVKEPYVPDELKEAGTAYEILMAYLFPNTVILGDNVSPDVHVFSWQPVSTGRCVTRVDLFSARGSDDAATVDEMFAGIAEIYCQDLDVVRDVQRGHESGFAPRGVLLVDSEVAIQRFHADVHAAVAGF